MSPLVITLLVHEPANNKRVVPHATQRADLPDPSSAATTLVTSAVLFATPNLAHSLFILAAHIQRSTQMSKQCQKNEAQSSHTVHFSKLNDFNIVHNS